MRLFSRSGSKEIQLLNDVESAQVWSHEKGDAIHILENRGNKEAARILKQANFELRYGTNEYNHKFIILYQCVPLTQYIFIANEYENKKEVKKAYTQIAEAIAEIGHQIRFIVLDLDNESDKELIHITDPSLIISNDVVQRALSDAERLIKDRGAASGVDRLHTAFHGYLKVIAKKAELKFKDDTDITQIFKILRTQHPALIDREPRVQDMDRILRSMATIITALNPIRNLASSAHPNEYVLNEPEAMLVINSVKTLLYYIDARLQEASR